MYNEKVMEYFKNPKNMGEMKDADGVGLVGNPICGDQMKIYIKVKDNRIEDIKFQTFGCVSAIATSSVLTELAKGKSLEEALKITNSDVTKELGGLPPIKLHCSVLAEQALGEAIYDYKKRNKLSISENLEKRHLRAVKETKEVCHH